MGSWSPESALFSVALFLPLFLFSSVSGQTTCSYSSFSNNKQYATCLALPQLSCFLHWTYNSSSGSADIAFRASGVTASSSGNWVAWALNPSGDGMAGAQPLVAYKNSNGQMSAYTSSVASTAITSLKQSDLSFSVSGLTAESSGSQIIIYATVKLPKTTVNQVWQVGHLASGAPGAHDLDTAHQSSKGSIDFTTGVAQSTGGGSRLHKKNVHGVLNAVSWGTLMPIGAIIARYLKVFKSADPAWFYLHIACQCSAYIIGVAGWATGLKLGSDSVGITYHAHRNIGITLFCLATLQVFALLLRPKKDNKHRFYWNLYHWGVGYAVIILSIINIFKGLDILDPEKKWKTIYIVVIIVLGCIALVLEASTWVIVLRRKKEEGHEQKYSHGYNGANGNGNAYAVRSQPSV